MTTTLLTGATGLLGPYLAEALASVGHVAESARHSVSHPCDLTDPFAARALVDSVRPNVIVHAMGWTDVDGCERDPRRAHNMNVVATRNLVTALSSETRLVYISTDQVYPDTQGPHREGTAAPVNVYGRTKLDGEQAVLEKANSIVLRTNFFGCSRTEGRMSLSDFFVSRLSTGQETLLFKDSIFSPLHMATLADCVREIISGGHTGVLNLGSREGMSKADFALDVARHLDLSTTSTTAVVSTGLEARAKRPADLRMDVSRAEHLMGQAMPTLASEIKRLLTDGTTPCGSSG